MKVSEALASRYTVRAFKPEPVSREKLLHVLESALRTPSWANTQPWEIFAASGPELEALRDEYLRRFRAGEAANPDISRPESWPEPCRQRMLELGALRFEALGIARDDDEARQELSELGYRFFGAPAVVFLCMDRTLSDWSMFDLGMMAQSIMLAAREKGLGSAVAYSLVAYPDLIRVNLSIPSEVSVVIGIALGYADEKNLQNLFRSPRRPLDEVVRLKGFQPTAL